jgi:hypothetical protein
MVTSVLVVDPWHWLNDDGSLPAEKPELYRRALRVARFIEYGGTLQPGEGRETLVQCHKRPGRKRCPGLMWVTKTEGDGIVAFCMACKNDEMLIHNWQETEWADGMMEPSPPSPSPSDLLH